MRVVPVNVAIAPARVVAHLVDGPVERERLFAEQERPPETGGITATSSPSASTGRAARTPC